MNALRVGVAGLWLFEGTWKKVLRTDPRHRRIVASVPLLAPRAGAVTCGIGLGETALAAWVLSGRRPALGAAVQTGALVGMNAGGVLFGRQAIPRPGWLAVRNLLFLAAIWSLA